MNRFEECLVPPEATLSQGFQALEASEVKILLVVDGDRHLLGTVTDGDLRRGILRGLPLDAPVLEAANRRPASVPDTLPRAEAEAALARSTFLQMPVLDSRGRVVDVLALAAAPHPVERSELVVLMAGGQGQRLRPLTDSAPKPMLPVGGRPILETIIDRFADQGFRRFVVSVHYRAADIVGHFGDGGQRGVDIRYVEEGEPRGTAGALAHLPDRPDGPIIVMNADILTSVDFRRLVDYHRDHQADATVCVREYDFRVPYGVVRADRHRLVSLVEKPVQRFLVSAGIYLLEGRALGHIPADGHMDMPDLLARLQGDGAEVCVFPIQEYWIDIGRHADLESARADFGTTFGAGLVGVED